MGSSESKDDDASSEPILKLQKKVQEMTLNRLREESHEEPMPQQSQPEFPEPPQTTILDPTIPSSTEEELEGLDEEYPEIAITEADLQAANEMNDDELRAALEEPSSSCPTAPRIGIAESLDPWGPLHRQRSIQFVDPGIWMGQRLLTGLQRMQQQNTEHFQHSNVWPQGMEAQYPPPPPPHCDQRLSEQELGQYERDQYQMPSGSDQRKARSRQGHRSHVREGSVGFEGCSEHEQRRDDLDPWIDTQAHLDEVMKWNRNRSQVANEKRRKRNSTSTERRRSTVEADIGKDFDDGTSTCSEGHEGPGHDYPGQFHEGIYRSQMAMRQDGTAEAPAQLQPQLSGLARLQPRRYRDGIFEKTLNWMQGWDPRDDLRFDTYEGGFSSDTRVRVRRRGNDGELLIPRCGSLPPQFDRSHGIPEAAGLDRTASHQILPRRAVSASNRPKPRQQQSGLEGARKADWGPSADNSPGMSSFFDNSAGATSNMPPRQAPGPPNQQAQSQHQVNGAGAAAPVSATSNGLPHAASNLDMQYLWSVIQELSNVLAQNRAQTAGIIGNVQQIQARARASGETGELGDMDGESNGELLSEIMEAMIRILEDVNSIVAHTRSGNQATEIADLQSRLHTVTRQRDDLLAENEDLSRLLGDFESTMNSIMERLRQYGLEHAMALNETRRHYNSLLEQEREANLALRLEHGQWQAGLGRAVEYARLALRERSKETEPLERKIREVKAENRILRRLVGWEVEEDSDDEEERRLEEERKMQENERLQAENSFPNVEPGLPQQR